MTAAAPAALQTPPLRRRLACMLYEGVLLFGVLMIAGLLYAGVTQQRHALQGQHGLQAFLFVVLGLYFVWFWTHGGQTVAMKTWHIRLLDAQGQPVSRRRALCRYLASWLWFVPALVTAWLARLQSSAAIFGLLAVGMLAYALLALLQPRRQYCHDRLCGTQLVVWRPAPRKR
ncbi:RDD family protein [Azohydromonas aeria]|uniref:RDD family protein n=1 Tax=Azohydromonas aeria TaxID=2590212 RepID=UPI001E41AF8B|nr:RDD family protein [Azohydromonas aeria]